MSPETKLTPNAFAGLLAPVESPTPVTPALDEEPTAVEEQVVAEQPQSEKEAAPKKTRSKKNPAPEAAPLQPTAAWKLPGSVTTGDCAVLKKAWLTGS